MPWYDWRMKEGIDRRMFLKGLAGAAAIGAGANKIEAAEKQDADPIKRGYEEINEKLQELDKAWKAGDKERVEELKRDLGERFERMEKLLKNPGRN